VLCYKRRRSSFDHAAGEVAYTAVQCAIWGCGSCSCEYITDAVSVATAFLSMSATSCTEYVPRPAELVSSAAGGAGATSAEWAAAAGHRVPARFRCSTYLVTAILGVVNFALVAGWMAWVIVEVHLRFRVRGQRAQGFKTSVGCMLRGE
jgi:hypothetical protein